MVTDRWGLRLEQGSGERALLEKWRREGDPEARVRGPGLACVRQGQGQDGVLLSERACQGTEQVFKAPMLGE